MNFPALLTFLFSAVLLIGCLPEKAAPSVIQEWSLLDDALHSSWQKAGIPEEGSMQLTGQVLTLPAGLPMTGCRFPAWQSLGLPETDYAIEYEAMRAEGEDIFGMCTFPVSSHSSHATFVIGGWGGGLTGISSIDFKDASENSTRAEQKFANGVWHHVRIEVRPEDIRAWVNRRPVVNVSIKGRQVGLRPGYIDHCLPFGFATWNTQGRIRGVKVGRL
jgi:hypothetical protein